MLESTLKIPTSTLIAMYRLMLLARKVDEKNWIFNRAGKVPFVVSSQGHEGVQAALAFASDNTKDYLAPYYRDLALVLGFGMSAKDIMLSYFAKKEDPNSGGRQMPNHFGSKKLRILSGSSTLTTQLNHAVGMAYAMQLEGKTDAVCITCFGDGSCNQGYFQDALNFASIHSLPVVFVCENNGYAISTPLAEQIATTSVAARAPAYNMPGIEVDGLDVKASYVAAKEAIDRARSGGGPTLIDFKVTRLTAHSSDDNAAAYIAAEDLKALKERDVLKIYQAQLMGEHVLTPELDASINEELDQEIKEAIKYAENAESGTPEEALLHVYEDLNN